MLCCVRVVFSAKGFQLATKYVKNIRFGFGGLSKGMPFASEVTESIQKAAKIVDIEVHLLDNRYDGETALKNAAEFVREEVDLVIEFQADEVVAPAIASKYLEANIPFIAIDIPHPGATYFGANNYEAGLIGGRYLGRWANKNWEGVVEEIVMVDCDLENVEFSRTHWPFLRDRRIDAYGSMTKRFVDAV